MNSIETILVGPNPCTRCGGEYGEHNNDCDTNSSKKRKEKRHRPATWMKMTGIIVLDPDGWRCDNKSMYNPLTEEEWKWRQAKSTCMTKKSDKVVDKKKSR